MSKKISIRATIKAPIDKAWDCYTNPTHIIHWNFASDDWQCPSASNDLKVGGKYSARMEAKDGSYGFDFEATYTSIEPGRGFSYEIADGREVDVYFSEEEDNSTMVFVVFEAESENPVSMQQQGWQAILNSYKKYTESI
jgi:uncharacterized protein YndB with AHSA1/START domain